MEAIRQDLESAVAAAAAACEDEAKVAIPIAEKASHKEECGSQVEDAGSIDKEEFVKSEAMDLDKENISGGADNVECTAVRSKAHATVADEVKRTKSEFNTEGTSLGPVACGEIEVTTALPAALSEVEVSTMTSDTCAEVEVSTSTPEDVSVKSKVKGEPVEITDESSNVTKVSNDGKQA
jgi:hypothetical protein